MVRWVNIMNYSRQSIKKKRMGLRSKGVRRKHSLFLIAIELFLLLFLTCGVCLAGLGYGAIKGIIASTPTDYNLQPQNAATTIYDDSGENIVQYLSDYDSNRILVSSEEIPQNLKDAFVAIEDERFYQHNGIDLKGIGRAIINNIRSGGISQGASTITQQLIKNNVFNVGGETNIIAKIKRKIQEQYLALHAEKIHDKDYILTNYLNTINLGKGTLGVEAAAKYYFGKKASELTLSESAVLAGITKNPAYLNPVDYPTENAERRLIILKKMLELNFITSEEYQEALADDTVYQRISDYRQTNSSTSTYSYFTDALILQIVEDLQTRAGYTQQQAYELVYRGGLNIYSTQNLQLQSAADEIINDSDNYPVKTKYSLEYNLEVKHADETTTAYTTSDLKKYFIKKTGKKDYSTIYSSKDKMNKAVESYKKAILAEGDVVTSETVHYALQPQLSYVLVDNNTSQIKVLVGGRGQKQDDLSLNRATSVSRQPGSTFKILSTYAPALDSGKMTLATVYDDAPYKYEDGVSVHNYEKTYFGLTTIRDAIIDSDNVIAVKTLTDLTPKVGFNYLLQLGFTTLDQKNDITQSLSLGGITDGVTNVELTAAYASIANKGEYNKATLYTKVTDSSGNIILENKVEPVRVMKESTAWLLTSAMEDVVKKGTGKEAKLSSDMAVAGKTGTSSNNYDYWFCGYTPYYTASIWTGYDYNEDFASGCDYHKEIWAKIMNRIIKETGQDIKKNFDSCDDITSTNICIKSGKKPVKNVCKNDPEKSMVRKEYFAKGTEPTDSCDSHVTVTLCSSSGGLAGKYCPKEGQYTKVYRKRPSGSKGTTADSPYLAPSRSACSKHTEKWYKAEQEKIKRQKLIEKQLKETGTTSADLAPTTAASSGTTATKKGTSGTTASKKGTGSSKKKQ